MRKLQLNPETLVVQSFETASGGPPGGTVRGNADTGCVATYDPCTCVPIETCSDVPVTPGTGPDPVPVPWPGDTGCAATSPCTCIPIETCSCAPGTADAIGWR